MLFNIEKKKKKLKCDYFIEVMIIDRSYPGSLRYVLDVFKDNRINITNVETNILNKIDKKFFFFFFNFLTFLKKKKKIFSVHQAGYHISFEGKPADPHIQKALLELQQRYAFAELNLEIDEVPWFPRTIKDLELGTQHLFIFLLIRKKH
jgi:prephenate dehydratase